MGKYRLLATANFEFVAIGVFEKERVVPWTVALANLGSLKVLAASGTHKLRQAIYFFASVRPKRDPCAIRFVVSIGTKPKEL